MAGHRGQRVDRIGQTERAPTCMSCTGEEEKTRRRNITRRVDPLACR
ncbi:hypothetical protein ACS15_0902 [Ralstonia insidiosa]|uniref:Uncharacterized protein n=1 Tax=Ralstonia insidiosa TaxID=190721 RepID=A0AAC9BG11_9RALS|nr:hypothetical protein ACS15_0902 [Ralstonia insidiosa]